MKTANRLKITAVWQYRPACVRLQNGTDDYPGKFGTSAHPPYFVHPSHLSRYDIHGTYSGGEVELVAARDGCLHAICLPLLPGRVRFNCYTYHYYYIHEFFRSVFILGQQPKSGLTGPFSLKKRYMLKSSENTHHTTHVIGRIDIVSCF